MNADPDSITISGFSGGAYVSSQFSVIYSDVFKGGGFFSGGPYSAANTQHPETLKILNKYAKEIKKANYDNVTAHHFAKKMSEPHSKVFINSAEKSSDLKLISSLTLLKDKPIFIHSNTYDKVVPPVIQWSDYHFFKHYGANVNFEWGDYTHEIPSITPQCYTEPNLILPGFTERF